MVYPFDDETGHRGVQRIMIALGIDGGGTSVRARAVDTSGEVLFEGKSGSANWASTPRHEFIEHLREALSGCPKVNLVAGCFAGILTQKDREGCGEVLRSILPDAAIEVRPDFHASLASCDDPDALCVVSGTGSLVCCFNGDQVTKSGGGGPVLGDWGSGYWAGRTALGRLLFAREESPASEGMKRALVAEFGSADINEVVATIYREGPPAPRVAKLGSRIAAEATEGDETCQGIIADAMQPLADLTIEHMRQNGFPQRKFKVYRTGGFWDASPFVIKYYEVQLRLPSYLPPLTPLEGAVRLAQRIQTT